MENSLSNPAFNAEMLVVESKEITELATKFTFSARKTAEGVLEMGYIVLRASKLKQSEFVRFCELVNISESKSTISKLKAIGEKYKFLKTRVESLPASWTTIYEITKLSNNLIDDLIEKRVLTTNMAGSALNVALGKPKNKSKNSKPSQVQVGNDEGLGFRAKLKKNPDKIIIMIIKSLLEELKEIDASIEIGSTLEVYLMKE